MNYIIITLLYTAFVFPQIYNFSDNQRITNTDYSNRFSEVAADSLNVHVAWVQTEGNDKNIMYSKSEDEGETFSAPIQINSVDDNIISWDQGPKIKCHGNKVYVTYIDDRTGYYSVYLNVSENYGETWQEEILISDTSFNNGYHDFTIDSDGNFHLVYYNSAANYSLEDVRYRFATSHNDFEPSISVGLVSDTFLPCYCCNPDIELDNDGNIYIAYRSDNLNYRDTYLTVKRSNEDAFTENHRISYLDEYIFFCPSSSPSLDIKDDKISIAYTSFYYEQGYVSESTIADLDFTNYSILNNNPDSFANYPKILVDYDSHIVWTDIVNGDWDVFYAMRNSNTSEIQNIQKINDDSTEYVQKDPILNNLNENLLLFWSDQRNGNYEIYFTKGVEVLQGDANLDEHLDVLDIIIVVNIILGIHIPDNIDSMNLDFNGDLEINIQDVIMMLEVMLFL